MLRRMVADSLGISKGILLFTQVQIASQCKHVCAAVRVGAVRDPVPLSMSIDTVRPSVLMSEPRPPPAIAIQIRDLPPQNPNRMALHAMWGAIN